MNFIDAIILGVVEGITEFLPISSTGHMVLTGHLLGIGGDAFTKSFEILIQLGAILAIVFLYRKTLYTDMRSVSKVAVAFLPTAIAGLFLYDLVKKYLIGSELVVVLALFIGGIVIVLFEKFFTKKVEVEDTDTTEIFKNVTYKQAVLIGLCQVLAFIPGVSRSAATILGGEALRLSRKTVVEFSFLLAIPTMLAASVLDVYKHPSMFAGDQIGLLVTGFITAFVVALISVTFLLKYIQKNNFTAFGYYRIILAVAYALLFI